MAGQPKTKQGLVLIREREEEIETLLELGVSQQEVWESLGVTRSAWRKWREGGGEEVIARARAARAHHLAEESLDIADTADAEQAAIAKARLRIDTRKWLSGAWNKEQYSQQGPGAAVQINFGQLHLDALRAANRPVIEGDAKPSEPEPEEDDDDWLS